MQTCETCKYKYFRNVIVPGSRNRDICHVCAFEVKNPNKGYVKSITRHNPATLRNEFITACEHFEPERHLTSRAADGEARRR